MEHFWKPVLADSRTVLLCVGQRRFLGTAPEVIGQNIGDMAKFAKDRSNPDDPISLFKLYYLGSRNVEISDVVTLSNLAGLMEKSHKTVPNSRRNVHHVGGFARFAGGPGWRIQ